MVEAKPTSGDQGTTSLTNASAGRAPTLAPTALTETTSRSIGQVLTDYHVGDLIGLIGLLLTVFTFIQATVAKREAKRAADAAIRNRDVLESAAGLTDLSNHLRAIAAVYDSDNWSFLQLPKDQAIAVAIRMEATLSADLDTVKLMIRIRETLREEDPTLQHIKEESKRLRFKATRSLRVRKLADEVELLKNRKVKHGS
jgi:hypothetical protein